MNMKKILILIFLSLLVVSCGENEQVDTIKPVETNMEWESSEVEKLELTTEEEEMINDILNF